jgi:hypothetical protein
MSLTSFGFYSACLYIAWSRYQEYGLGFPHPFFSLGFALFALANIAMLIYNNYVIIASRECLTPQISNRLLRLEMFSFMNLMVRERIRFRSKDEKGRNIYGV